MNNSEYNLKDFLQAELEAQEVSSGENVHEMNAFEDKIIGMAKVKEEATEPVKFEEPANVAGKQISIMDVEASPIHIDKIVDTEGRLSAKVAEALQKYNVRAIPLEVAGVLRQTTELQNHVLTEINGVKYATVRTPDSNILREYRDAIYKSLSAGLPYTDNLFVDVLGEDGTFKTLKLLEYEWSWLCVSYKEYNAKVTLTDSGELILSVGC